MFARESNMAASVARWMKSNGMVVKSEFVTPWGLCDLVGLTFNPTRVNLRLRLRQRRAIGSITRALILLQIPDVETRASTTRGRLVEKLAPSIPEEVVSEHIAGLIADRFVVPSSRGRLQRMNGWMPLQDRLIAVELKLSRIGEAMHQAMNNLAFAEESYVALPAEVAQRVASGRSRWSHFFDVGIGLLSAKRRCLDILVPARRRRAPGRTDEALQFYCVEKFWRTRVRGN